MSLRIRLPLACGALMLTAAIATVAAAAPATVHHSGRDTEHTCFVGAPAIDLGTGAPAFVAFEGRGMHVFANNEGGEGDMGLFHCQADLPLGEMVEAPDALTGLPILAYVLTFEEACGGIPGSCNGKGVLRVHSEDVGGFAIAVHGLPTTDWVEHFNKDGKAMLMAWYGH